MVAIVSRAVFLPLNKVDVDELKKHLTVKTYGMGEKVATLVPAYEMYEDYIAVPRAYGMQSIAKLGLKADTQMSSGIPVRFPKKIAHTGEYVYQENFVRQMVDTCRKKADFIAQAATGKGKCLAKGTRVLMYSGRVMPVEQIKVGDLLMGPDSTPRRVLSLASGREEMYCVSPVKGDPYTVNRSHILSLKITGLKGKKVTAPDGRKYAEGEIVDISVEEYLRASPTFRHVAKGWRTGVEFSTGNHLAVPPYILGSWLGDGSSRYPMLFSDDIEVVEEWRGYGNALGMRLVQEPSLTVGTYRLSSYSGRANLFWSALRGLGLLQNKHIPEEYLTASREERLQLLAGLIDTDGCISCGCFDFVSKFARLANDTAFIARSLGFAAYVYPCTKRSQTGAIGAYFRVRISGDISTVPCRVSRKRAGVRLQKKNVLHTGISVAAKGVGDYYGFEIDGDRRFLLGDFTVTHNTVCALSAIQRLGRNAIILVDQQNLLDQWVAQAKDKLGLREEQIGIVQGKRCEYEGKAIVIAMIQSLVQRDYPEEFYDYFGTLVVDEVHTAGAPTFSQALMMFSAEARFGISATVDRRDALQKILHWNLGAVDVSLTDTHDRSYVYYLESPTVYSWYANISPKVGRMLTEVSEDTNRNELLVEATKFLYESGRDVLVVSDRIEQLEDLMAMSLYAGIKKSDMGLYCGYRNVWGFEKDPKPKRKPFGYEKGTEYTPVTFTALRKRIPKKVLDDVKNTAKVVFATFGMFAKGVDVPRLSGGVDCTPRSKAQQVHGRILRLLEGKYVPIWVTIRDFNSYRLEHQFVQRLSEYVESSAEIYQWKIDKGVRSRDVRDLRKRVHQNIKELKALNVITQLDGRNTLVTPTTPRK